MNYEKWVIYGIKLISTYFILVLIWFVSKKLGVNKTNISEWILAAAAILGYFIGLAILQIYRITKNAILKSHNNRLRKP